MSVTPKNSITKSIGLSNVTKSTPNNKADSKASGQVVKSTETNDDANVAKEESTAVEPGKPISKDADKAAADTTKALWSGYWDFKKSELDNQRGIQKDQLDFQKQQAAQQAAQQNSQIGAGIAASIIGAATQAVSALGQTKGGGGSSGGGSTGADVYGKSEEDLAQNKKGFEDQGKVTRVDSKGNPIIEDQSKISSMTGTHGLTQDNYAQQRPISHPEMHDIDARAESYDHENGISFGPMRGNQEEDISFSTAHNDAAQIPEPEIPEIEIQELA